MAKDDPLDARFPDEPDPFPGLSLMPEEDGMGMPGKMDDGITSNRERHFNKRSGRFHDPDTGMFEDGAPPPDLDASVDRYRAKDGRFKKRSTDLFDEPEEVALESLEPEG